MTLILPRNIPIPFFPMAREEKKLPQVMYTQISSRFVYVSS